MDAGKQHDGGVEAWHFGVILPLRPPLALLDPERS